MMKYVMLALLLAVCTAQADDHVRIEYHPGYSMSDRAVTITIARPFDKSGTVIPEVFKRLKAITALKTKSFMVPDAAYITIVAEMDSQRLESSSCHTLFEANRNLVAHSTGVSALDGVTRPKALSAEPKDFMDFRRLWEEALSISMKSVMETFKLQPPVGGDGKPAPPQPVHKTDLTEQQVLDIAHKAVQANDTWADRAKFEAKKSDDGTWSVMVWRIEGYDKDGKPQFVPGGDRLITIDRQGKVTNYGG